MKEFYNRLRGIRNTLSACHYLGQFVLSNKLALSGSAGELVKSMVLARGPHRKRPSDYQHPHPQQL
jgi:hypothetical protein